MLKTKAARSDTPPPPPGGPAAGRKHGLIATQGILDGIGDSEI